MKEIGRAPTFELQSCSCLRLQLMNGFLTFWAIFATHQLWEREAGMSKKAALVSAHWCPGQMVPSGTWSATSSSKMLRNLSKIGTTQTLLGNMSNIDICWKPGLAAKNHLSKDLTNPLRNVSKQKIKFVFHLPDPALTD